MNTLIDNKEKWFDIKGAEGFYQFSNMGRIKRLARKWSPKERILKKVLANNGYYVAHLSINRRQKVVYIHRLLAEQFIPRIEGKYSLNHKDGNKLNNDISNLEWCTQKENIRHAFASGLVKKSVGSETSGAKLDEIIVKRIKQMIKNGVKHRNIAKFFNISKSSIWGINARRTWTHVNLDEIEQIHD